MITLRGINFGSVIQPSGATNFDLKGWWYHKPLHFFGLDWSGSTGVTKTTTLLARKGNMPLKTDGKTPKEWLPRSIIVDRKKKAVLNAVSLSGPGLEFLIDSGWWQKLNKPFLISVMSLEKTADTRKAELRAIFEILSFAKRSGQFHTNWGVQINLSCPNGGVNPNDLVDEAVPILESADGILPDTIPVMPKFGPEIHPRSIARIVKTPRCDALCVFNTMPFGKHPAWSTESPPIDWKGIFGTDDPLKSPMAKRFPTFAGGYSGPDLLPFLLEWLRKVRARGIDIPICAGGGILCPKNVGHVFDAGGDAVSFGSIAMLAPTQVQATIREAHRYDAYLNGK